MHHNTTHGYTGSATYRSWSVMIQRCTNPMNDHWSDYGGRGIIVDPEWFLFQNFLRDMGERPVGLTLDRIEVNGNYCKANCRWSTHVAQCNNRRSNIMVTNPETGEELSITQWLREFDKPCSRYSAIMRYRKGYSFAGIFFTPTRKKGFQPGNNLGK